MSDATQRYRWYIIGCDRLNQTPLTEEEFGAVWQRYEDYAEMLKTAEKAGTLADIDGATRRDMERIIDADPMMKAVLIGQSESGCMPGV